MNEETKNAICSNAPSLDFARLATLTEDELAAEQQTWTNQQWREYYLKDGYMTIEEMDEYVKNKIQELWELKYGNQSHLHTKKKNHDTTQ